MSFMEYPEDETDLTVEQMDSLMEGAEEVELVRAAPLYEIAKHDSVLRWSNGAGLTLQLSRPRSSASSRQEYAFTQ